MEYQNGLLQIETLDQETVLHIRHPSIVCQKQTYQDYWDRNMPLHHPEDRHGTKVTDLESKTPQLAREIEISMNLPFNI